MAARAAGMTSLWYHLAPVHLLLRRPLRQKKAPHRQILVPIRCQKSGTLVLFAAFPFHYLHTKKKPANVVFMGFRGLLRVAPLTGFESLEPTTSAPARGPHHRCLVPAQSCGLSEPEVPPTNPFDPRHNRYSVAPWRERVHREKNRPFRRPPRRFFRLGMPFLSTHAHLPR